jgi:HemY protein
MRRIFLVLVACAIVLAIAWGLSGLPGRLALDIGDTTLETTTPVAALGLLIIVAVAYAIIRFFAALVRSPRAVGRMRSSRRHRVGQVAITRTLVALAAGEKGDARREASRARRLLGDTPQTLLLTAEAGRLAGREDEAETAFRALAVRSDAGFLGYRGLLRQAIAKEDWAEAAALARQAEAAHPGAAWLRQERAGLAIQAGNWAEALELADNDAPKAALGTAAAMAESDPTRALRLARDAWKQDPSLVPAAVIYSERLRATGKEKRAMAALRESWTLQPHPELGDAALAPVADKLDRLKAAQALTQGNPEHPESRLLIARAALDAGQPAEARHQIEAAQSDGLNTRRMWMLLAEVEEEQRGDTEIGRLAQRDALRKAAEALPDDGWRCSHCHTPQPRWQAACPACGTAGSIRWASSVVAPVTVPAIL